MAEENGIEVLGLIKKVESKTSITNDKVYRVTLETWDHALIKIAEWRADQVVKIKIEKDSLTASRI